jgi:cobalt/nickel transport system permease protein
MFHIPQPSTNGLKIHAQVKLLMVLSYIIAVIISSPKGYLAWVAFGMLIMLMFILCRVKLGIVLARLLTLIPFIALCALGLLIGGSVDRFVQVVVKSTLCVTAMTWLSLTTPFSEIIHAMRKLRMPSTIVTMLSMLYRYIFVLGEEALRMQRAFLSRCPRKLSLADARYIGMMVGSLLLRAYDRAERIHMAMLSRCFSGEMRVISKGSPSALEWLLLIAFTALAFTLSAVMR